MIDIAEYIPYTGRNLERVLELHKLPLEIFEGAVVYDLGCGRSNLGYDLAKLGMSATAFGFDKEPRHISEGSKKNIDASIDNIPMSDKSADIVLATFSLPYWANTVDEIMKFYSECTRVTKTGGHLSVYPIATAIDLPAKDSFPERSLATKAGARAISGSSGWLSLAEDPRTLTAQKL